MIPDTDGRWDAVGGCPTPGHPEVIGDAAKLFAARAARSLELHDALQSFGMSIGESGWQGRTADAFLGSLARLSPALDDGRERAAIAGSALYRWADVLHQLKGRAVGALEDAEDAQRRIAATDQSHDDRRQADDDLAQARTQLADLAQTHAQVAAQTRHVIVDVTTPAVLTTGLGVIAQTMQGLVPGLGHHDSDGGQLDAVASILESIQGGWIDQAGALGVALLTTSSLPATALAAGMPGNRNPLATVADLNDGQDWVTVSTPQDTPDVVPLQAVDGLVTAGESTSVVGLHPVELPLPAVAEAPQSVVDLAAGLLRPPTIPASFGAALASVPRHYFRWFEGLQPVVAAASGEDWLDLVDVDQTFVGPTLAAQLLTFAQAGGTPVSAPLDPGSAP